MSRLDEREIRLPPMDREPPVEVAVFRRTHFGMQRHQIYGMLTRLPRVDPPENDPGCGSKFGIDSSTLGDLP